MPKYKVYVQEIYDVWYEVEADTEEEAWEAYYEGEAIETGREYAYMAEGTEELIEDTPKPAPTATWSFFGKDEEDIL